MTIFIWLELALCSITLMLIGAWLHEHRDQDDLPDGGPRHRAGKR